MLLLEPYRVLDLAGPFGFSAGKILADLGADVIKVEPPKGELSRHRPPLVKSAGGESQGLYWLAYNANKRGITLDLHSAEGPNVFRRLAGKSDFILETFQPGTLDRLGIGYEQLRRENPRLILVSITPYGQKGPYEEYQGSDLEIMALSGAMSLAGEPKGEPMRFTVPQAPMWASAEAAMGALTALAHRGISGKGQHVDVSGQIAMMAALSHAPAFWDLNRTNPQRAGIYMTGRSVKGAKMRVFWPVKDGWINFIIYGGVAGRRTNQQLVEWMSSVGAAPDWFKQIDWNKMEITKVTQEEVDKLEEPIAKFFATLTKLEFYEGAVKREMLGYPVFTVEDIYKDSQLAVRNFWQEVHDPTTGATLKYPGGFALVNGERLPIRRPAPQVGEHNEEIYVGELGLKSSEIGQLEAAGVL